MATPLTSLSDSSVGSRETNSFCSNWTTTYGLALEERTLRPRAEMSLTCICPLDGPLALLLALAFDTIEPLAEVEDEADSDLAIPDGG